MADVILLDTDVLSFTLKADTRAELYRTHIEGRIPAISFMTLAEVERWPIRRNWGQARRDRLYDFLERYLLLGVDRATCVEWAEVTESARRAGRPIQTADAWIAATARRHTVPLLTHNREDYVGIANLQLISEAPA